MIDDMWEFQDGTVVVEEEENHLPVFAVYDKHDNVVRCYPHDRKDAEDCMEALDNGENPITAGWEDGHGNLLSDLMGGMGKSDYTENTGNLIAVINGEAQSTVVSGVHVSRIDGMDAKYSFTSGLSGLSGYMRVYGDDLEVDGNFVHLLQGGVVITSLRL